MSLKRVVLLALGLIFVFGLGYIVWAGRPVMQLTDEPQGQEQPVPSPSPASEAPGKEPLTEPTEQPQAEQESAPVVEESGPKTFTMVEVAAHGSTDSCWSAINGSVYDLTSWISRHPGGPGPIKALCGADGSAKFSAVHGGSSRAQAALILLKIGVLKN